jgi:hypothetical protein
MIHNKRVLIWHFTLVLIKINYGRIGDQTGLFYTMQQTQYFIPVEIDLSIIPARLGIFSLVPSDNRNTRSTCPMSVFTGSPDNRTNVNVEACTQVLL